MALERWFEIAEAAGFAVDRLEPVEVYQLAARVIRDLEQQRAEGKTSNLAKMTVAEKLALRERVSGVVQLRR